MKIFLGADHRGYALKEKIAGWILEWGYNFVDLGNDHLDPKDDYTLFAERVASMVGSNSKKEESFGILLCGSGVGVEVVANKFDGVRAGIGKNVGQVKAGRADDDMNVLVIAAEYTKEAEAKDMVRVFIETKFSGKARFLRRLENITKIEANN